MPWSAPSKTSGFLHGTVNATRCIEDLEGAGQSYRDIASYAPVELAIGLAERNHALDEFRAPITETPVSGWNGLLATLLILLGFGTLSARRKTRRTL